MSAERVRLTHLGDEGPDLARELEDMREQQRAISGVLRAVARSAGLQPVQCEPDRPELVTLEQQRIVEEDHHAVAGEVLEVPPYARMSSPSSAWYAAQERFAELAAAWRRRGIDLGLGIGIDGGYATLGRIGFEGRFDYGAVGPATNRASRLSTQAAAA